MNELIQFFKKKVSQSRYLEASSIADFLNEREPNNQIPWGSIAEFLRTYHWQILSFSQDLSWINKLDKFEPIQGYILEKRILKLEKERINNLLRSNNQNPIHLILLESYRAYYSLVTQDGFRLSYHLSNCARFVQSNSNHKLTELIEYFEFLNSSSIGINKDKVDSKNRSQSKSLYVEADRLFGQIGKILDIDLLKEIEIFIPNFDLDRSKYLN